MEAFDIFDKNRDKAIDKYELKGILDAVSENDTVYSEEHCEKIISAVDTSGDGKI